MMEAEVPGSFYAYIVDGSDSVTIKKGYYPEIDWRTNEDNMYSLPFISGTNNLLVAINATEGTQWIWENDFRNENYEVARRSELDYFPEGYKLAAWEHNNHDYRNNVMVPLRFRAEDVTRSAPLTLF